MPHHFQITILETYKSVKYLFPKSYSFGISSTTFSTAILKIFECSVVGVVGVVGTVGVDDSTGAVGVVGTVGADDSTGAVGVVGTIGAVDSTETVGFGK